MISNPVLLVVHNCLDLTKRCVDSLAGQTIPIDLLVIDNGSVDGTSEWLREQRIYTIRNKTNEGVTAAWNLGLGIFFHFGASHVLVPNNDTVLAPWTYEALLSYGSPFVSGVPIRKINFRDKPPMRIFPGSFPDFSLFLITQHMWDRVGEFDERMLNYASDCDYHVRAHRLDIPMSKVLVPFYHEPSSTLKKAPERERREIEIQADRDREVFRSIYGVTPWQSEYFELFK